MHFGLESSTGLLLYVAGIAALLMSIFWRPIAGLYYLVPLIPLQTVRYRLNEFPLGASLVGLILLAIGLGVKRNGDPLLPKTPWTRLVLIFGGFTFVSLWLGAFYLGTDLPFPGEVRFGVWQDYMVMPALLLMVVAVKPSKRQMLALVLVMCLAGLVVDRNAWSEVSGRDFSSFSNDLRDVGGSMGYAGVNGLAAFEAQFTVLVLALAAFERKRLLQLGYYSLAAFSGVCLMYSLSRGGYIALLAGCFFLGLAKQRKLLILLIVFLFVWTAIVPTAVTERVSMTNQGDGELDHSSETRLTLWQDAIEVFDANVITGTGFATYAFMHRVGNYEDTHNLFLKVLVETGILGLILFLWLIARTFRTGYRLFRNAKDPLFSALGLGLAGWVVTAFVANCFGDRWMFLQVCGYLWVLAGLVARALEIESQASAAGIPAGAVGSDVAAENQQHQVASAV